MKPILLDLPMPILTPRLQLRPRRVGEGVVIAQAIRESMVALRPWMAFAQQEPSAEAMEEHARKSIAEFISRTNFTLSIYDRRGETFLGSTGLHNPNWDIPSFHLGYWISEKHAGQGLIQESSNALTRYAFQVLKARRVEIRCDSRNQASFAVMRKLGFEQEGLLRFDELGMDGAPRDTLVTARYNLDGMPPLAAEW